MRKGTLFLRLMLVLIFLALVANLVVSAVTEQSLISEDLIKALAFYALVAANLCLSGAGIYFCVKTQQKHEKSSVAWGLRGFVTNAVVTVVFFLAPWFFYEISESFSLAEAMKEIAYILLLFGIPQATFLYSFYREYLRNVSSGGPRARRTLSLPDTRE